MSAAALRPAEEIVREMVARIGSYRAGVPEVVRLIEQAREEGAAAERARRQPEHVVLRPAPDVSGQWIAYHVKSDLVTQGDSEPHALRMLAEAIEMMDGTPAQPRDLAGRIRALIQEYAGRCADADSEDDLANMRTSMQHLRHACRVARKGFDVGQRLRERIEKMRDDTYGSGDPVSQAADELDAIVRECTQEEKQ